MKKAIILIVSCLLFHLLSLSAWVDAPGQQTIIDREQLPREQAKAAEEMLSSLLELHGNLQQQIELSRKKLEGSTSESEKKALQEEIAHLDRQLSESTNDFERIATGVELALFAEKKPAMYSWKSEMASLVEPAIKELKRFTIKARQKTDLKDRIVELQLLKKASEQAVEHLQTVVEETEDTQVKKAVKALQPEWINVEKRLENKLET